MAHTPFGLEDAIEPRQLCVGADDDDDDDNAATGVYETLPTVISICLCVSHLHRPDKGGMPPVRYFCLVQSGHSLVSRSLNA